MRIVGIVEYGDSRASLSSKAAYGVGYTYEDVQRCAAQSVRISSPSEQNIMTNFLFHSLPRETGLFRKDGLRKKHGVIITDGVTQGRPDCPGARGLLLLSPCGGLKRINFIHFVKMSRTELRGVGLQTSATNFDVDRQPSESGSI